MSTDAAALAATLASFDPRGTIRPVSLEDTVAHAGPVELPEKLDRLGERITLSDTIGQGGMAIVRSATQTSLHREVAVKTLRDDATEHAAPRLLREAWITGALEHPNIVPVHDLGADDRGRPLLVLKRIEGKPWSPDKESLEDNLATLMQVCHAIAFAHSRGIVHRDLKPANIMIGGFGEVYVLDWGIAVSTADDGSGRLPLASDCKEIAGTLAYMAPEMLGERPPTQRTDIYLLGAILYEIVEGKPPHLSASIAETIESIKRCDPVFSSDTPAELAAIVRRAMARDDGARPASADELRLAIAAFLEHRSSAEIARESEDRLRELEAKLADGGAPDDSRQLDRVTIYSLFSQCRFGFQAALRGWPENTLAREGLDRALGVMASHELDHGDARAAQVLLAELSVPRPDLAARHERVEHDVTEKRRKLERYELDSDVNAGGLTRTFFLLIIGIAWSVLPLLFSLFTPVEATHGSSLTVTLAALAFITGFAVWARESLLKTAVNRGVLIVTLLGLVVHASIEIACWILGLPLPITHMFVMVMWAGVLASAAVFIDRALILPALGFLAAFVLAAIRPEQRFLGISGACSLLVIVVVYTRHCERHGKRRVYGLAELLRRKD